MFTQSTCDSNNLEHKISNLKRITELNILPALGAPATLQSIFQDELRHLRRLAAARLAADHNDLVLVHHLDQLSPLLVGGQLLAKLEHGGVSPAHLLLPVVGRQPTN